MKPLTQKVAWLAIGLAVLACVAAPAKADIQTYSFICDTPGVLAQCATGESQLLMDVVSQGETVLIGYDSGASPVNVMPGPSQFALIFRNTGPLASFIEEIYIEFWEPSAVPPIRPLIPTFADFYEPVGVDFVLGAAPASPPGMAFSVNWSADADQQGANQDGIDPYQALGILFNLSAGTDYAYILNALDSNVSSEDMRVALHVKGLAPLGGSEAFENSGRTVVPEPTSILGLGTVLFFIGSLLKRKKA
jgi:hypothetical protein